MAKGLIRRNRDYGGVDDFEIDGFIGCDSGYSAKRSPDRLHIKALRAGVAVTLEACVLGYSTLNAARAVPDNVRQAYGDVRNFFAGNID